MQNLIELHGGRFELLSELRKGTEAIAYFPPSRTLQAMPPLQPLGQERHRQGETAAPQRPIRKPRLRRSPGQPTAAA